METLGAAGAWNATTADLVAILDAVDPDSPGWKALSPESHARDAVPGTERAPPGATDSASSTTPADAWGHTGTLENTHAMVLVQPDGVTWAITVSGNYPSGSGQLRTIMRGALAAAFPTS